MGCDIHAFVEYKKVVNRGDEIISEWIYYAKIFVGRDYILFKLMADVRGNQFSFSPVFEARGLPQDISGYLRIAEYKPMSGDAHTPSYLSSTECSMVAAKYRDMEHKHNADMEIVFAMMQTTNIFLGETRLVFWFDN